MWLAAAIALVFATNVFGQQKDESRADSGCDLLWKKVDTRIRDIAEKFEGVMGVAIFDLTDGRILLHNGDRVFPTASSIKIAILAELYRQDQEMHLRGFGEAARAPRIQSN